jgi:hypothetical protein
VPGVAARSFWTNWWRGALFIERPFVTWHFADVFHLPVTHPTASPAISNGAPMVRFAAQSRIVAGCTSWPRQPSGAFLLATVGTVQSLCVATLTLLQVCMSVINGAVAANHGFPSRACSLLFLCLSYCFSSSCGFLAEYLVTVRFLTWMLRCNPGKESCIRCA